MPNEVRPRGRGWRRAQLARKKDLARTWFADWKCIEVTPRMVGMKATTPRGCSCALCKGTRGLRIGELRRTLTVAEAVADIFDDRYIEAEAAFHEAMLDYTSHDWYEETLEWDRYPRVDSWGDDDQYQLSGDYFEYIDYLEEAAA